MLFLPEGNHVAALLLAVVVPGNRVYFQNLWHFYEAAKVHALAKRHGQPLVTRQTFAYTPRRVGHVL